MTHFSLPLRDKNRSGSSLFNRRHMMLFILLAITSPLVLQTALGVSSLSFSSVSDIPTEGALDPRDYHGIVHKIQPGLLQLQRETNKIEKQATSQKATSPLIDATKYPEKDQIPDVNHPQVKAWVAQIDWSKVPKIPVAESLADARHFPKCPPKDLVDKDSCWWSCDACEAKDDIVTCPNPDDWGLTYDDGPSEASRSMMKHLKEKGISATFFIVGSRVLEYPEILKEQVDQGHHIALHTWSHCGLTTLTNEQIVAEVRWAEKIIKDMTGVTTKYIRPPFGDTDNRVREILRQMGYTIVIWTQGWDTNDWRVAQRQLMVPEVVKTFTNALNNRALVRSPLGKLGGPVTLEHDLTEDTIELSKQIIPMGIARGLKPMSLAQCLADSAPYQGSTGKTSSNNKDGKGDNASKNGERSSSKGTDITGKANEHASDSAGATGQRGSKSDATVAIRNGFQTAGYAVMGLAIIGSYMLTL